MFRILTFSAVAMGIAIASPAFAQKANLLTLEEMSVVGDERTSLPNENLLRDAKPETATSVRIEAGQQLEIVYQFGEETVTIEGSKILVRGLQAKQATLEILASTLSPTTGFRSLRVEPINKASAKLPQTLRFEPAAAKWAIIRVMPTHDKKPLAFSIAEIELNGYVGIPKSAYLFSESPADAIKVLSQLSDSIPLNLSEDEQKLFVDAKDGKLDEITFAEASLLSSGITEPSKRKELLDKIDQMESQCKQTIFESLPPFERGQKLLEWLHAGPMSRGYVAEQTDVSAVLKSQQFNCVSSATLYNILGRRIGLDVRGIEVPDHAFSILYDGTKHVDIETTNRVGFNPARNRAGLQQFQQATGFVYIPESNRSKRREIGDTGMVALTYYNHGVTAMSDKRHSDAMVSFFKALSLDAGNKSAVKNILAALGKWSNDLYDSGDKEKSLAVLEVGRELAPDDRTLKHNQKAVWQQYIKSLVETGKADDALELLANAYERTQDNEIAQLQSWVFVLQGKALVEAKDWQAALASVDDGLKVVDQRALKDLQKWKRSIVFSWSSELLDQKKFDEAVDVIEIGLKESNDWRLNQRLAYLAQEWSRQATDAGDAAAGHEVINALANRFPNNYQLGDVAASLAGQTAKEFLDAKDYESALKVYQAARKLDPDNWRIKQSEEAVWLMFAKPHVDARRWGQATDIYERARKSMPTVFVFQQNLAYVAQELGSDTLKENGVTAAEEAIVSMAGRFPKVHKIQTMRGRFANAEINRLVKAGDFDAAHESLVELRKFWRAGYEFDKVANGVYYQKAKPHLDAKDWDKAIAVFDKGNKAFPKNRDLQTNLQYAWLSKAKPLLDAENWEAALAVYRAAAKSLPNSSKIKNNIRYCEAQLKKAGGE